MRCVVGRSHGSAAWWPAVVALLLAGSAGAADTPKAASLVKATVTKVNDGDSIEVDSATGTCARAHVGHRHAGVRPALWHESSDRFENPAAHRFAASNSRSSRRTSSIAWWPRCGCSTGDKRTNINETMLGGPCLGLSALHARGASSATSSRRRARRSAGLWAQPVSDWVYPPEWRFLKNGEIRSLPAPYAETREKCVAVLGLAGAATYAGSCLSRLDKELAAIESGASLLRRTRS